MPSDRNGNRKSSASEKRQDMESLELDDGESGRNAVGAISSGAAKDKNVRAKTETQASASSAKAPVPAEASGFTLRLALGKSGDAVLSGLKAMGAETISVPGDGKAAAGEKDAYVLRIQGSMLKDIGPYLERYGGVERKGPMSAVGGSLRVILRILPAAK